MSATSVSDFYAGKSVFITGGAGYLGKVLVEKLLFSCPGIDKIYLLLRGKRNCTAEQRYKSMLNLPIFSRLRTVRPGDLDKIVPINGDIGVPGLNLSEKDLNTIIEKVSVVIHSAASIKFKDPLKFALNVNYEGTANLINVCHKIKNINVFVYISTAYSNTDREIVEEVVYPPPKTVEEAYRFAQKDNVREDELMEFLNGRPNTYTFTKAMAESIVAKNKGIIPVVIIRPSIVTPSMNEPLEGWVDNWYGATGLVTALAKGLCRAVYVGQTSVLDLIPVDYVCNLTIVAATKAKQNEVLVYNSCSGDVNPITTATFCRFFVEESMKHNFSELPCPNWYTITRRRWILSVITCISFLFAFLADLVMRISFRKPRFTNYLIKALTVRDILEYFTANSWTMRTTRTLDLYSTISVEDAVKFPFNPKHISWKEYIPKYFQGVNRYLMKKEEKYCKV